MTDLISRADVLKYPIRLDHYDEEHGNIDFVLGIESVMEYVEALPSADAEWTPVCSELPEMNEDVLVTLWGNQLEIGYFTFGERGIGLMFCANDFEIRGDESVFEEVDAWMPLPKPYKGGAK